MCQAAVAASAVHASRSQPRSCPLLSGPTSSTLSSAANTPTTTPAGSSRSRFRHLSPEEMAEKRKKGECYFCPEIFIGTQVCNEQGVPNGVLQRR
jgi:hypothetical protein